MRLQRFGRTLCIILEPRYAQEAEDPEEAGDEEGASDSKGPWFDHWKSGDGHFFRFGRLSVVYASKRWRESKRDAAPA
jgi:hypothetical protein